MSSSKALYILIIILIFVVAGCYPGEGGYPTGPCGPVAQIQCTPTPPRADAKPTDTPEIEIGTVPLPKLTEPPPEVLPPEGGEHPPESVMPMFDTAMFYYGGSCTPNQIRTEIMVSDPEAYSVVMFYRLRDMESETRTEWEAMAMNPTSDGYYMLTVASSSIPDREMFMSAYFQVQIVGTNQTGDEILRTDVVANQITLLACGEDSPPTTDTPDLPECSDGIDNDGDGLTDMADGRCTSPDDDSEAG